MLWYMQTFHGLLRLLALSGFKISLSYIQMLRITFKGLLRDPFFEIIIFNWTETVVYEEQ